MKFLTYINKGTLSFGFLNEDETKIKDLGVVFKNAKITAPKNLLDFVVHFEKNNFKELISNDGSNFSIELNSVEICAPFHRPIRNVICLGKNYVDHINEVKNLNDGITNIPKYPIYFSKLVNKFSGPLSKINVSTAPTNSLDYEVELALIVGKECKNISRENAGDYIFGYMVGNDFSARDLQSQHSQWLKGKSLDGFCAIGPYITTYDEIGINPKLHISTKVNSEIRQNSSTELLIFPIDYILEDLSKGLTLYPGDIILTGTPSGVGAGYNPPKYLNVGDEVICEIEKIGVLKNIII